MSTKPTRLQQQACDHLAEALLLISGASHLDGRGRLGAEDFDQIARRVADVSSAFTLEEIVVRALERKGRALGLREGAAEMLTLMDAGKAPLELLRLPEDAFRELVGKMEAELGDV